MLAFRALPSLVSSETRPTPEWSPHPILTSLLPALDTAFGLEPAVLLPDRFVTLAASLEAALATRAAELADDGLAFREAA